MEINNNDEEIKVQIPIRSACENTVPPAAPAPVNPPPPAEFYAQLIKTINNLQAPQQPAKIIIEARDHKESVNFAKLQNGMLQLKYASSETNWDNGVAKNIWLATFSQGFLNLLARSASV